MNIEEEIKKIQQRNQKVEADKAWEQSKTRKFLIAILTYFIMVCIMYVLKLDCPFVGAIIPTLGFILSTFSVEFVKLYWLNKYMK